MNATTLVGTTAMLLGTATVEAAVVENLGGLGAYYDVQAITEDFRAVINADAPSGFVLVGDLIFNDAWMSSGRLDVNIAAWRRAVSRIDFWEIVATAQLHLGSTRRESQS